MRLTFVVGTGRCGSTMLSAMLREHPDVLLHAMISSGLRIAAVGYPLGRGRWSPARPCPSASPAWFSRRTTPPS
jgi:hypothetical protein